MNELKQQYFKSDWLAEDIWKNGYCLLADISWNTCAYVARYVNKKQFGFATDEYVERMTQPSFSVMSRNPGIGMYYPREHDDFAEWQKKYFSDQNGSIELFFPKEFLRYLEVQDPDRYEQLRVERADAARNNQYIKVIQSDLSYAEQLQLQENKLDQTSDVIDFYRGL